MRIAGGKYRGKKLFTPQDKGVRPTEERVREAVFSILYSRLGGNYADLSLLDVFAGTGAFGLEAVSRGFAYAAFVDKDTTLLQKNIKLFSSESEKLRIIKSDAVLLPCAAQKYDVVYTDAPYAKGLTEKALARLAENGWLKGGALCIAEIRHDEEFTPPGGFTLTDERIYGQAKVLFLNFA